MTKVLAAAASLVYDYGKVKVAGFDPGSSSKLNIGLYVYPVAPSPPLGAARGGGSAIAHRAAAYRAIRYGGG